VATIAGIPILEMSVPEKAPQSPPITRPAATTSSSTRICTGSDASFGITALSIIQHRIPDRSATATTVRSIPPLIIASIIPRESTPISGKR